MSPDNIDSFVVDLVDFLEKVLPKNEYGEGFFEEDDRYVPLLEFVHNKLENFCTRDRNYN